MSARLAGALAGLSLCIATGAQAGAFDFTSLGVDDTDLGLTVTVGGIRADPFVYSGGSLSQPGGISLWLRNEPNDHGLGVCSESNCATGGGDVNEISGLTHLDILRLTRPAAERWTSLWVSSLDGGGTNGTERGTLFWSDTPTPSNLLGLSTSFQFAYPGFGHQVVEGDLFALMDASTRDNIANAQYLFFKAGAPGTLAGQSNNNDYLVWKGTTRDPRRQVPEPSVLALAGIAAVAALRSRRKR
jgi:hypothetical protein